MPSYTVSSQNGKQFSLKFKTVIAQHIMTGITCGKVAMETYLKEEELSLQSVKVCTVCNTCNIDLLFPCNVENLCIHLIGSF